MFECEWRLNYIGVMGYPPVVLSCGFSMCAIRVSTCILMVRAGQVGCNESYDIKPN